MNKLKQVLAVFVAVTMFTLFTIPTASAADGPVTINGVNTQNPAGNHEESTGFWGWCKGNKVLCSATLIVTGGLLYIGVKELTDDDTTTPVGSGQGGSEG